MPPRRDPSEDGVLNPLSPGLAVLDARLPLLALALRSLGILLLGARLAGVLTAHLATLHLFHGGHHVRLLGGLVRFEYLPHLFRKAMSDLPKTGTQERKKMPTAFGFRVDWCLVWPQESPHNLSGRPFVAPAAGCSERGRDTRAESNSIPF